MRILPAFALAAVLGLAPPAPALAVNPQDISVIGNLQYQSDLPGATLGRSQLSELELSYQGYLSPSARAEVFISIHPGETDPFGFEVEPEETYVTLLDLPLDSALRVGKLKASFGKLNRFHNEQWFSVDQPVVLASFLGDDGLQDLGAEWSVRIPNPWDAFIQLNTAILDRGSDISTPAGRTSGKAGSFRLSAGLDVGEDAYVETGLSGLAGPATASTGVGVNGLGAYDLTYRWRPDRTTSFTTTLEYLALDQVRDDGSLALPTGGYLWADWQFWTHHDLGFRLDHAWRPDPENTLLDAVSVFYTFSPWELNKYRLQAQRRWSYEGGYGAAPAEEDRVLLQVLFTMGPHKHPVTF